MYRIGHHSHLSPRLWAWVLTPLIIAPAVYAQPDPFHVYLTWQGDTSTTITVNYHTRTDPASSTVLYDLAPRNGVPEDYAFQALGASHRIAALEPFDSRTIHVVELAGLAPGKDYYFIAGDPITGYTTERIFRTVPRFGAVRFITGGDMSIQPVVRDILVHAAATDPMFGLIGGDVAYVNGNPSSFAGWDTWLTMWEELMVGPGGNTIPIVLAIGNHETAGGFSQFSDPPASAPFYFGYFAQDGSGFEANRHAYFSRQFGANTVIHVLDTGHVTPFDVQGIWLNGQMAAYAPQMLQFAVYHVPMYPSHRSFDGAGSALGRQFWRPSFDAFGLIAAFENHDHMLKRTKRLIGDVPDPEGTLYLGDGCFGQTPRSGDQAQRLEDPINFPNELSDLGLSESYLETWAPARNFWLVEIPGKGSKTPATVQFTAFDESGTVKDFTAVDVDLAVVLGTSPWASLVALVSSFLALGVYAVRRSPTQSPRGS